MPIKESQYFQTRIRRNKRKFKPYLKPIYKASNYFIHEGKTYKVIITSQQPLPKEYIITIKNGKVTAEQVKERKPIDALRILSRVPMELKHKILSYRPTHDVAKLIEKEMKYMLRSSSFFNELINYYEEQIEYWKRSVIKFMQYDMDFKSSQQNVENYIEKRDNYIKIRDNFTSYCFKYLFPNEKRIGKLLKRAKDGI